MRVQPWRREYTRTPKIVKTQGSGSTKIRPIFHEFGWWWPLIKKTYLLFEETTILLGPACFAKQNRCLAKNVYAFIGEKYIHAFSTKVGPGLNEKRVFYSGCPLPKWKTTKPKVAARKARRLVVFHLAVEIRNWKTPFHFGLLGLAGS